MTKATKQVSTKTKARKPAKPAKRKAKAQALQAGKDAGKRQAAKARTQDWHSWIAGYEAGLCKKPCDAPKRLPCPSGNTRYTVATDVFAWHSGYAEGTAQERTGDVVRAVRAEQRGMAGGID